MSTKQFARTLRKNQTDAENWLWRNLRNRELGGWKFRRQYWVGNYVVDFVCIEKKLIIELDGGQHALQVEQDDQRSGFLIGKGFQLIRFWNNEVLQEGEAVLNVVLSHLNNPSPPPSPLKSGERVRVKGASRIDESQPVSPLREIKPLRKK
jgi:very-short-patch-repair endonuclease